MIVFGVVCQIVLVGQLRDMVGMTAGDIAIAVVGKEQAIQLRHQRLIRVGESALHLVIDHAVAPERTIRTLQLIVPALLTEGGRVGDAEGVENGVQIDVHQIEKVLLIPGTDGVHGLIREGHGVEEGLKRALQQLHKGLLHGVLLRAAEDGVLQNVEDAGVILRDGLKCDGKGLVVVVPVQPDQIGSVFFVLHAVQRGMKLGERLYIAHGKAVKPASGGQFHSDSPLFKSEFMVLLYQFSDRRAMPIAYSV